MQKKSITRDNGTVINLQSVSDREIIPAMHWDKTTFEGGRAGLPQGDYVFVLDK